MGPTNSQAIQEEINEPPQEIGKQQLRRIFDAVDNQKVKIQVDGQQMIDIQILMSQLEEIQKQLDKDYSHTRQNEELVIYIGNSRVGKTTIMKLLSGVILKQKYVNHKTVIDDELSEISNHTAASVTIFCKIRNTSFSFAVADTPGCGGNIGILNDILNAFGISKLLELYQDNIKLIYVADWHTIQDNARAFIESIEFFIDTLRYIEGFQDNIGFVMTQVPIQDGIDTSQDIQKFIDANIFQAREMVMNEHTRRFIGKLISRNMIMMRKPKYEARFKEIPELSFDIKDQYKEFLQQMVKYVKNLKPVKFSRSYVKLDLSLQESIFLSTTQKITQLQMQVVPDINKEITDYLKLKLQPFNLSQQNYTEHLDKARECLNFFEDFIKAISQDAKDITFRVFELFQKNNIAVSNISKLQHLVSTIRFFSSYLVGPNMDTNRVLKDFEFDIQQKFSEFKVQYIKIRDQSIEGMRREMEKYVEKDFKDVFDSYTRKSMFSHLYHYLLNQVNQIIEVSLIRKSAHNPKQKFREFYGQMMMLSQIPQGQGEFITRLFASEQLFNINETIEQTLKLLSEKLIKEHQIIFESLTNSIVNQQKLAVPKFEIYQKNFEKIQNFEKINQIREEFMKEKNILNNEIQTLKSTIETLNGDIANFDKLKLQPKQMQIGQLEGKIKLKDSQLTKEKENHQNELKQIQEKLENDNKTHIALLESEYCNKNKDLQITIDKELQEIENELESLYTDQNKTKPSSSELKYLMSKEKEESILNIKDFKHKWKTLHSQLKQVTSQMQLVNKFKKFKDKSGQSGDQAPNILKFLEIFYQFSKKNADRLCC